MCRYVPHYFLARTQGKESRSVDSKKKVLFATSLDCSFHSFLKRDAVCVGAMEHEECDFQF